MLQEHPSTTSRPCFDHGCGEEEEEEDDDEKEEDVGQSGKLVCLLALVHECLLLRDKVLSLFVIAINLKIHGPFPPALLRLPTP